MRPITHHVAGLRDARGWAVRPILPGLALTTSIAAVAFGVRQIPGVSLLSPLILATAIGVALRNTVGVRPYAKPGITFSLRRVLRLGIVLLGFQLMLSQVIQVGVSGVALIAFGVIATFVATKYLGRLLGVDPKLAELIAAGTSICGASAVIATNTVTRARDEDVAYAVASVTVFGSIAMLVYPLLPHLLGLGPKAYGLWTGASVHEIAQVVGAGFQDGRQAGEFATVAKLTRVMMLAPMVLALGVLGTRRTRADDPAATQASAPVPWFVFGFILVMLINSAAPLAPSAKAAVVTLMTFLLSMALAAMGLETDFQKLKAQGVRPLILGGLASIFIAVLTLVLIKVVA